MDLPHGSLRESAPHVVLVGAGGVGCWLYASLREAARRNPALARVTLVARGAALDRVRSHGLQYEVRGEAGEGVPQSIVVDPQIVRSEPTCAVLREQGDLADYVILCVKTWQARLCLCVHAPTRSGTHERARAHTSVLDMTDLDTLVCVHTMPRVLDLGPQLVHTLRSQVTEAAKDAALILRENGCIITTQNGVAAPAQASAAVGSEDHVLVGIAKVRLLETCCACTQRHEHHAHLPAREGDRVSGGSGGGQDWLCADRRGFAKVGHGGRVRCV